MPDSSSRKNHQAHFIDNPDARKLNRIMALVIQVQDQHRTIQALTDMGLVVTRLASTGVFLGRRNVTLLIGFPEEKLEAIVEVIHQNCRQRVEYISTHLEGAPMPIPIATPITIGGGTVFTLAIERFEEI